MLTTVLALLPLRSLLQYITYNTSDNFSSILAYGEPKDLEAFCCQAQIVNFTQYKALLEGWGSLMWEKYVLFYSCDFLPPPLFVFFFGE